MDMQLESVIDGVIGHALCPYIGVQDAYFTDQSVNITSVVPDILKFEPCLLSRFALCGASPPGFAAVISLNANGTPTTPTTNLLGLPESAHIAEASAPNIV
ncbi:hypothetical protein N5F23_26215 [Pseudomonas sichuanensis]|uniref:hypothetical protein n=1 Tax=Pseudomonas sichuanensis TaxID=2213015 RepID=UPI002446BD4C|nr:hypothetical protein [Pseudomonas sichuanensis]MDH0732019.1 hypothetical protein [Pseudomonas sichuanensis]MDH1586096.1 hypothetical protein [Pseudomonas sichuanensis]MDH1593492.1 hypothetical protein [Pseudomonas sichuanensis]MDH1599191.1 hypothetical protein [Pseudomonas sichuanensis]